MTTSRARCTLWLDGCFDGFHYAHANAVRQALYLISGDEIPCILVGVHSDKEIVANKGPPLFDEAERYNLIRGCRWVHQVIENVPYVTQLDIVEQYHIDFVVHGDDAVFDAEGNDCYAAFKKIGRILRPDEWNLALADDVQLARLLDLFVEAIPSPFPMADFKALESAATCHKFRSWSPEKKVVYLSGAWDCFGAGHVELLRRAKDTTGCDDSFLVVGLWPDEVIKERTGEQPLLALLERALAVVQCRYTDGVIISVPRSLPSFFIRTLGINVVVNADGPPESDIEYVRVEEPLLQSVFSLRDKLQAQFSAYEERQKRKGG